MAGPTPEAKARTAGRSLKGRALQWLSQREHSRAELRRKLLPHARAEDLAAAAAASEHCSADAAVRVEEVLDWLESHRYLCDERFAESRLHARAARFGNLRIRQELKQHHVALSPEAAQALRDTEFARASEVRERKFASWPQVAEDRARQARFLAGRGFSPETVQRLLRSRTGPPKADD